MMTPYRHDLDAAHRRIAVLENENAELKADEVEIDVDVDEVEESASASKETSESDAPPDDRLRAWHWWPIPALAILIAVYVRTYGMMLTGASSPLGFDTGFGAAFLSHTSLSSAILGVLILLLKLALQCIPRRSRVVERLLSVIAVVVALPFILRVGFALLNIAGMVFAIVSVLFAVLMVLGLIYRWISTGSASD